MMDGLKQIANVAGYSGLYRILKPSRSGVIVESLDDKKEKTMMGPTARVSVLNDISIYIDGGDEPSKPLGDILLLLNAQYGESLPVTHKASDRELTDFMAEAVSDYDRDKVRTSDIKKLVNWYTILRQHAPELFEAVAVAEAAETAEAETPTGADELAPVAEADKEDDPKAV
jgi:hypothetical protein